jgi:hypothetical protein
LARQKERGAKAAEYLELGAASLVGEGVRQLFGVPPGVNADIVAIEGGFPESPWDAVTDVVGRARSDEAGIATLAYAEGDYILAAYKRDVDNKNALNSAFASMKRGRYPRLASHTDRIHRPLPLSPPVTYFPLLADDWLALLTGRLLLLRLVDLSLFEGSRDIEGTMVDLRLRDPDAPWLQVALCGEELALGPRFIEEVLYGFQPIAEIAECAVRFAVQAQSSYPQDREAGKPLTDLPSRGPKVTYTTVYVDDPRSD